MNRTAARSKQTPVSPRATAESPEDPDHRGSTDVHTILDEAGAVGGADNTAEPAGANFSHEEEDAQRDETEESEAAETHYSARLRPKKAK